MQAAVEALAKCFWSQVQETSLSQERREMFAENDQKSFLYLVKGTAAPRDVSGLVSSCEANS